MSVGDAKKLAAVVRRAASRAEEGYELACPCAFSASDDGALSELVYSLFLYDAASAQARNAYRRAREAFHGLNELRVCSPEDVCAALGERYPGGEERAARIRCCLGAVFVHGQTLTLAHLTGSTRKQVREALESIEGCHPFAAARVALLRFEQPCVPVDGKLLGLLVAEGVFTEGTTAAQASQFIEREWKGKPIAPLVAALQQWADGAPPPSPSQAPAKRSNRKKTAPVKPAARS